MNIKSKKGFTIIEVVLVLAIAGLIFLMVFIALPNMQRTQRDRQKTQDYSALSSNITNYLSNNNGNLPGTCSPNQAGTICKSPEKYINTTGQDQSGKPYKLYVVECGSGGSTAGPCSTNGLAELQSGYSQVQVYVVRKAKCDSTAQGKTTTATGARAFAVVGQLETGVFCLSSE
jgi:prepilin-type N-terminal cleavage/methylation domain-containing protein